MEEKTLKQLNPEQQKRWDGFMDYLANLIRKEIEEDGDIRHQVHDPGRDRKDATSQ